MTAPRRTRHDRAENTAVHRRTPWPYAWYFPLIYWQTDGVLGMVDAVHTDSSIRCTSTYGLQHTHTTPDRGRHLRGRWPGPAGHPNFIAYLLNNNFTVVFSSFVSCCTYSHLRSHQQLEFHPN